MTSLGIFTAGLQLLSSWLMSMLALLTLIVSVIVCLVFVEVFIERGAVAQAYTVKTNPSGEYTSSATDRKVR